MEILKVEHVTKRFARHTALDDVSLTIPKGSVYGLLGPNGAGKTTLIRIINRITAPDEGKVIFDGCEIQPQDVYRIGYLPEERGLYKKMKVGEQAVFFARLKGLSRHEAVVRLKKARTQRCGQDHADPHHQPHYGARRGESHLRRLRNPAAGCLSHRLSARGARSV